MNRLFSTIPVAKPPRNIFNLSHTHKTTLSVQRLMPSLIMEGLPGDKNLVFSELMARAMPLVAPVFQSFNISQHAFFVPMRTLNHNWEQFITGGEDGTYSNVMPYTTQAALFDYISDLWADLSVQEEWDKDDVKLANDICLCLKMFDYAGLPFLTFSSAGLIDFVEGSVDPAGYAAYSFIDSWISDEFNLSCANSNPVNLLPFYAMLKIWSEYYRDENLVEDPMKSMEIDWMNQVGLVDISEWSTDDFLTVFKLRNRAWKKDRFTSALPFTQRGPDVLLPIAGNAPVEFVHDSPGVTGTGSVVADFSSGGVTELAGSIEGDKIYLNARADFSEAELTTTINDFRRAERLQRWYENSARGGSRLNENTLAHWGVRTPDATLDRSVFLGGISQPLVISEIQQNSQTTDTSPQGNLAGKGTSYNNGKLLKHFDSEHGYTIVFCSILQNADYCQGLPRLFTRQDRFEYAWPEFANLGEEPIMTREIDARVTSDVFGYTPRYSDYKSLPNRVSGDMKYSLASWCSPRLFDSTPKLNEGFIYHAPDKASFAVESGFVDEFVVAIRFNIKSSRLLPFYGVPTI